MAVIFGWGGGRNKDIGATVLTVCPNCSNEVFFHYLTSTKWFSLFFIPIVPYEKSHLLLCPICTQGRRLNKGQAAHAKSLADAHRALTTGQLSPEAYRRQRDAFMNLLVPVTVPGRPQRGRLQTRVVKSEQPRSEPPLPPGLDAPRGTPRRGQPTPPPMRTPSPEPGWYHDPSGRHERRYWNENWTEHVTDGGVPSTDPPR